jgi:hypothetical protein
VSSISSWGKKRQGSSPEDEPPGPHAEANFDLFALKSDVRSVIVSGRQSLEVSWLVAAEKVTVATSGWFEGLCVLTLHFIALPSENFPYSWTARHQRRKGPGGGTEGSWVGRWAFGLRTGVFLGWTEVGEAISASEGGRGWFVRGGSGESWGVLQMSRLCIAKYVAESKQIVRNVPSGLYHWLWGVPGCLSIVSVKRLMPFARFRVVHAMAAKPQ